MANELYRVDNGYGFGSSNGNITASDTLTITANSINLGSNANVQISGGSNGQVLTTNGNSGLSWTTVSGGGSTNIIYEAFNGSNAKVGAFGSNTGSADLLETSFIFTSAATGNFYNPVYASLQSNGVVDYSSVGLQGGNIRLAADVSYAGLGIMTLESSNVISLVAPNVSLGDIANLHIIGGNSGEVLSTDGAGNLSWISAGGGSSNTIYQEFNGSNAKVTTSGSNSSGSNLVESSFLLTSGLTSNIYYPVSATLSSDVFNDYTDVFLRGGNIYLEASNIHSGWGILSLASSNVIIFDTPNVALGDIANLHITGGNSGEVLSTDGAGTLSWISAGGGNTGNVTFDDVTVQGVNGLNLSAGPDFTANLAYLQVRSGDVASHIHFDTGNNEAYDLIVGDDSKHVQVSSTGNIIMSAYDSGNSTAHALILDNTGNLTLPGNTFAVNYANGTQVSLGGGGASNVIYSTIPGVANANIAATTEAGSYNSGGMNLKYYSFAVNFTNEANNLSYGVLSVYAGQSAEDGPYSKSMSTSVESLSLYGKDYVGISTDYMSNANSYIQVNTGNLVLPPVTSISMGSANAGEVIGYDDTNGRLKWVASGAATSIDTGSGNGNFTIQGSPFGNGAYANIGSYNFVQMFESSMSTANGTVPTYDAVVYGRLTVNPVANVGHSGNINAGNINISDALYVDDLINCEYTANVNLGAVANIHISGGSSGQVLSTDGAGNLSWISAGGGSTPTELLSTLDGGNAKVVTGATLGDYGSGNVYTYSAAIYLNDGSGNYFSSPIAASISQASNGGPFSTDVNIITGNLYIAAITGSGTGNIQIISEDSITVSATNNVDIQANVRVTNNKTVDFTNTSNLTLGAVANLHIAGGGSGDVLSTDGAGNLSWTTAGGGGGAASSIDTGSGNGNFTITGSQFGNGAFANIGSYSFVELTEGSISTANGTVPTYDAVVYGRLAVNSVSGVGHSGNIVAGNLILSGDLYVSDLINCEYTANVNLGAIANVHISGGSSGQVLSTDGAGNLSWISAGGGGGGTPGGSNTQIQFNDAGSFGGSANLTFDKTTNTLSATTISGTLSTAAQPNITSVGTLTNLTSNGNVILSGAGNVSLGDIANVHISGGFDGQYLRTDGAGNLVWASAPTISQVETSFDQGNNITFMQTQAYSQGGSGGIYTQIYGMSEANRLGSYYQHVYANFYTYSDAFNIYHAISFNAANGIINLTAGDIYANGNVTLLLANGWVNLSNAASIDIGNVANVHISGGNNGDFLKTNGTGNLSWARPQPRSDYWYSGFGSSTAINSDTTDQYTVYGLDTALTFSTPTGNPVDGQKLMIRIKDDGNAQTLTWTTGSTGAFRAVGVTLPTTTVANKLTYLSCVYNEDYLAPRWDVISMSQET
jgi:hypothetical protein